MLPLSPTFERPAHLPMTSRTLRGGKTFSPYEIPVGKPIPMPAAFDLANCVARLEKHADLGKEESDVELDPLEPLDDQPSPSAKRKRSPSTPVMRPWWIKPEGPTMPKPPESGSHRRRRLKREACQLNNKLKSTSKKHRARAATNTVETKVDMEDNFSPSGPAWIGKRGTEWVESEEYTEEELEELCKRLIYIGWDGVCIFLLFKRPTS
ncbi:hypothetical protein B0H10DRAFT_1957617 [Mycena sp. CBHHK59/15]|nr:hypothetical protein B0H10DRAFT_1957617 [Mycena sp. CBHHK59/15]